MTEDWKNTILKEEQEKKKQPTQRKASVGLCLVTSKSLNQLCFLIPPPHLYLLPLRKLGMTPMRLNGWHPCCSPLVSQSDDQMPMCCLHDNRQRGESLPLPTTLWTTISATSESEKQEELLFTGISVPAGPDTYCDVIGYVPRVVDVRVEQRDSQDSNYRDFRFTLNT